jgi:hypothetical protein
MVHKCHKITLAYCSGSGSFRSCFDDSSEFIEQLNHNFFQNPDMISQNPGQTHLIFRLPPVSAGCFRPEAPGKQARHEKARKK